MNSSVLILGSGAREHALAIKLAQSDHVKQVLVAPGNGGTQLEGGKVVNLALNLTKNEEIVAWCIKHRPTLVVVGPEDLLDRGIADDLVHNGIECYGPQREAAQIECNKQFAKDFMTRHDIPTARYRTFTDAGEAKSFIRSAPYNALVVKASGLAGGKGVVVANTAQEACDQVDRTLTDRAFGDAGNTVVVEELLIGQEVSVFAFTDGRTVSLMPAAQDHKRAFDNDMGPNTGGMGAYCPCPFVSDRMMAGIQRNIMQRTVDELLEEGKPFVGTLYAGLIITDSGPKVLEFNCRFGDPETQSVLPLLESDLFELLLASTDHKLANFTPVWSKSRWSCGVVIASAGYPGQVTTGLPITGIEEAKKSGLQIIHGGTHVKGTSLVSSGGRVLSVIAVTGDLESAVELAKYGASKIKLSGSFYRRDIGHKALKKSIDYKSSGVDIEAGEQLVGKIKHLAKSTLRSGVMDGIGGFGALFDLKAAGYVDPVLVSGTDGVGTKLKVAFECKNFSTVGIDLVAMCVNDILVQGAEPLFFLDYFACGKLDVSLAAQVIGGIATGCRQSNCALVGGETAEMPGMYINDEFDLAGFAVGAVSRAGILPRTKDIAIGDVLIGLPSSGVHSNGFSLVRRILSVRGKDFSDLAPFTNSNSTIGDELLVPTKLYVRSLLPVLRMGQIKALAHITGGGLLDNIPRILPGRMAVELDARNWKVPPVFKWLQGEGNVSETEMLRTFNCGIGMVVLTSPADSAHVLRALKLNGEPDASIIGHVTQPVPGQGQVTVRNFMSQLSLSSELKVKKRVAVLISGSGTNLQTLLDHTLDPRHASHAHIALVISNVPKVEGLLRAQRVSVKTKVITHSGRTRAQFEECLNAELEAENIDLICLAGFMRILTDEFASRWEGRLINVHPSLLPAFKGIHVHEQVISSGCRVSGCTVHFVDSGVDTGAIILQEAVPVYFDDTPAVLQERIKLQAEHKIFPLALEHLARGEVHLDLVTKRAVWTI